MPPVRLTFSRFDELRTVNADVNLLPFRADQDRYGVPEYWATIDLEGGDCDDYALEKRRRLLNLKWPVEALRLATCWTEDGGYHCVLTVDTDKGAYVLDNRQRDVMAWGALPYRWDKRQAAGGTGWVSVG